MVSVSSDFGVVLRKAALRERGVALEDVLKAMDAHEPLGSDDDLLSFGPHFGQEAANVFSARLDALGLLYVEDYFVFTELVPPWCALHVSVSAQSRS
jgi:hypothetical protein